MDWSRLFKKPKLEDQPTERNGGEGGAGLALANGGDDASLQEQEDALVALIEHRTKECQILKQKLDHYKSLYEEAEKRLSDSQVKLVRLRSKASAVSTVAVEAESVRSSFIRKNQDPAQTRAMPPQQSSRPQLVIPPQSTKPASVAADARAGGNSSAGYGGRTSSSSSAKRESAEKLKPSSEKRESVGFEEKKIKKKLEQKEHQDLIRGVGASSSPSIIRFQEDILISSQHKRKLRNLELCPVNDHLFVTSALDGVVNLWQVQAEGSNASLLSTMDCLSPKQRRWPVDIAWHPDGDVIFAAYSADCGDSQISVLNLNASQDIVHGSPRQYMGTCIPLLSWELLACTKRRLSYLLVQTKGSLHLIF